MPAPHPILPPAEELDSHDALLVRDAANQRRRRRVRWLAILGGLALVVGGAFGGRPAVHAAKQWQARRLAREAMRLTEEGNLEGARTKVQDALTIWRLEPEVMHATAFFLTRGGGYRQALPYWQQFETVRPLTPADLREYATAEFNVGDTDAAEALLHRVWLPGEPGIRPDWTLGLQIALRRGHSGEALELAKRLLADSGTPPRERLNAATVLLASNASSPADRTFAWKTVSNIAHEGKTAESLSALILLAQQRASASANQPAEDVVPPLPDLMASIESHPLATAAHHLLVVDLRIAQDATKRSEFIQAAVDRFSGTKDDGELAALAAWLYGKGEFEKVLAILPLARAVTDRALYLQYLDTLAALERWAEIRELIQARKFPLDTMISQMFLARCAGQLGELAVRDARWQAALDAAGTDPGKLLAVGQYAEKNGVTSIAAAAFRAVVRAAPDARPAYEELVRLLESTGDTAGLRATVAEMAAHWPQDLAIRNDVAYLDALSNENVLAARNTARELVRAEPGSLAHRVTLALAELRLHAALAALDAFSGVDLGRSTALLPRHAAVYAAVLWETSYNREAHEVLKNLATNRLLPEERELVRPIENDASAQ